MPKSKIYAIEIKRTNYDLIRLLNKGVDVETEKRKMFFVFTVSDTGESIRSEVMTQNDMLNRYEISSHSLYLLGLK